MISYEQTLWLWERLCPEEINIKEPEQVPETAIRHCIFSLQERGKYTFYALENCVITYDPARRRDFSQAVSTTAINNCIRNLKAFFTWYEDPSQDTNPTVKIKQLRNERKAQETSTGQGLHCGSCAVGKPRCYNGELFSCLLYASPETIFTPCKAGGDFNESKKKRRFFRTFSFSHSISRNAPITT